MKCKWNRFEWSVKQYVDTSGLQLAMALSERAMLWLYDYYKLQWYTRVSVIRVNTPRIPQMLMDCFAVVSWWLGLLVWTPASDKSAKWIMWRECCFHHRGTTDKEQYNNDVVWGVVLEGWILKVSGPWGWTGISEGTLGSCVMCVPTGTEYLKIFAWFGYCLDLSLRSSNPAACPPPAAAAKGMWEILSSYTFIWYRQHDVGRGRGRQSSYQPCRLVKVKLAEWSTQTRLKGRWTRGSGQ